MSLCERHATDLSELAREGQPPCGGDTVGARQPQRRESILDPAWGGADRGAEGAKRHSNNMYWSYTVFQGAVLVAGAVAPQESRRTAAPEG